MAETACSPRETRSAEDDAQPSKRARVEEEDPEESSSDSHDSDDENEDAYDEDTPEFFYPYVSLALEDELGEYNEWLDTTRGSPYVDATVFIHVMIPAQYTDKPDEVMSLPGTREVWYRLTTDSDFFRVSSLPGTLQRTPILAETKDCYKRANSTDDPEDTLSRVPLSIIYAIVHEFLVHGYSCADLRSANFFEPTREVPRDMEIVKTDDVNASLVKTDWSEIESCDGDAKLIVRVLCNHSRPLST